MKFTSDPQRRAMFANMRGRSMSGKRVTPAGHAMAMFMGELGKAVFEGSARIGERRLQQMRQSRPGIAAHLKKPSLRDRIAASRTNVSQYLRK